jgi:hypoxanthine phosphoribosyltransferase
MDYKKELLIPREVIAERIKELAEAIEEEYRGKELILIGILKGAVFFLTDLARELSLPIKLDFIRVASYGSGMEPGSISLTKDVELSVEGKPVLIVEDIVDTGQTLSYVKELLESKGAESVKVCVLIDKKERREKQINIDYCAFRVEKGFLVGYGLDYNEEGRCLPEIYVLKECK